MIWVCLTSRMIFCGSPNCSIKWRIYLSHWSQLVTLIQMDALLNGYMNGLWAVRMKLNTSHTFCKCIVELTSMSGEPMNSISGEPRWSLCNGHSWSIEVEVFVHSVLSSTTGRSMWFSSSLHWPMGLTCWRFIFFLWGSKGIVWFSKWMALKG